MRSVIMVHPDFDRLWPFAADHFRALWQAQGPMEFLRLAQEDRRLVGEMIISPESVIRLVALQVPLTQDCLSRMTGLRELAIEPAPPTIVSEAIKQAGIRCYMHSSEGFWAQSVAEFALALTLCGLRRIPQLHREIITNLTPWNYEQPEGPGRPGVRGQQFGDDMRFVNGTVAGKRVRIVGAGNIASRYASFMSLLGADVAAWDPYASEPCFHRAGSRRDYHLDHLVSDAEIFAPMVPLTETTHGLITREHLLALPRGCLVVLATRAQICDMPTLRERVLADEVSLAADVWDVEPLPLDDALLGRHNVVHTPHNAGRTMHANQQWAEALAMQFDPVST